MELTPKAIDLKKVRDSAKDCTVLILAAGYEDRARAFLDRIWPAPIANIVLLKYPAPPAENEKTFEWMQQRLAEGDPSKSKIAVVPFDFKKTSELVSEMEKTLSAIPDEIGKSVWIDVSGLTNFAICIVMYVCRKVFPFKDIELFYTDAVEYYPRETDYRKWLKNGGTSGLQDLPPSLTSEMAENLILDIFSGFTLRKDPTCLIMFAGYEKHRSIGAIESVNPGKLVMIYGVSPDPGAKWRLQMSKALHKTLITERERAEEEAPLFDVGANVKLLTEYYEMLYDDHSICVAPTCSKMQAVATYLVWERFRDIQLTFPLPVSYLANRSSIGARNTYHLIISQRASNSESGA